MLKMRCCSRPSLATVRLLIHHPIPAHNVQFDWIKPTLSALNAHWCSFLIYKKQCGAAGCWLQAIRTLLDRIQVVLMVCIGLFYLLKGNCVACSGQKVKTWWVIQLYCDLIICLLVWSHRHLLTQAFWSKKNQLPWHFRLSNQPHAFLILSYTNWRT